MRQHGPGVMRQHGPGVRYIEILPLNVAMCTVSTTLYIAGRKFATLLLELLIVFIE